MTTPEESPTMFVRRDADIKPTPADDTCADTSTSSEQGRRRRAPAAASGERRAAGGAAALGVVWAAFVGARRGCRRRPVPPGRPRGVMGGIKDGQVRDRGKERGEGAFRSVVKDSS